MCPSDRIWWEDEPPEENPVFIPIYSAQPRANTRVIILSDHLVGVWTHFIGDRTMPCSKRDGGCVCDHRAVARRWKGYLGAFDPEAVRTVLLELTIDAVRNCAFSLSGNGPKLRGMGVRLFRIGRARNSPVRIELAQVEFDRQLLPPAPDIQAALRRIWSIG